MYKRADKWIDERMNRWVNEWIDSLPPSLPLSGQFVPGRLCVRFGSPEAERGPPPCRSYPWQPAVLRRVWRPRWTARCRLLLHLHGEVYQVENSKCYNMFCRIMQELVFLWLWCLTVLVFNCFTLELWNNSWMFCAETLWRRMIWRKF